MMFIIFRSALGWNSYFNKNFFFTICPIILILFHLSNISDITWSKNENPRANFYDFFVLILVIEQIIKKGEVSEEIKDCYGHSIALGNSFWEVVIESQKDLKIFLEKYSVWSWGCLLWSRWSVWSLWPWLLDPCKKIISCYIIPWFIIPYFFFFLLFILQHIFKGQS